MRFNFKNVMPSKFRKALKWAAVSLAAYSFIGFIILPPIIRSVLANKLSESLHRQVTVKQIDLNPFMLSLTVKGVVIKGKDGKDTFVSFDRLYVNLQSISIIKRGVVLQRISLDRPYIHIVRNDDLTYNFSDLIEKKGPNEEPLKFSLNNIRISGGGVVFDDMPTKTAHKITDINVTVPFISNLNYYMDTFVQPSFSATVNGTPVSFKGETKPFSGSLESKLNISLNNLDIPYYLAYAPFKMNFKVPSGYLDVNMTVSYTQFKDNRPPALVVMGDAALRKLAITDEKGGPLVNIPSFTVSLLSSDIMARNININQVRIDSPRLDLVRDEAGRLNILSIIPEKPAAPAEEKPASAPVQASVFASYVRITNGTVNFSDHGVSDGFKAVLRPVELTVVNFSSVKDWKTTVGIGIKADAGESVRFNGEVVLAPLKTTGAIYIDNIPLQRYSPYYKDYVLFDVIDGKLGLSTGLKYSSVKEAPEAMLHGLSVKLESLKLQKSGEKSAFLDIPELEIHDTSADLVNNAFTLGSLVTKGGFIGLTRFKDGSLSVMKLAKTTGSKGKRPGPRPSGGTEKPWDVTLKSVDVDSWRLKLEDVSTPKPATLTADDLKLGLEDISTAKGAVGKVSLSFTPNGKGSFATSGTASINPMLLNLKLDMKDVITSPMQPYIPDNLKIIITNGRVAASGSLLAGYSKPKGLKLKYTGDVSMYNFASIDKQSAEDFLKWKALNINGMDISYNPNNVKIKEIALADFFSAIIVNPDKTINVLDVMGRGQPEGGTPVPQAGAQAAPQAKTPASTEPAPPTAGARPAWPVKVDKITVQGGRVSVTDRSITPPFSVGLTEIGGHVTGLSSEEIKMADLDMKGIYDNSAPIEITGKLNPLREDLYIDLKVRFTDMDLSPVTPYAGKYLGYKIEKGKVSFDLQYLIVKKTLDSKNNIFIDQLTLGEKVDNPDATKLPVKLAIALLRDRNGEIHLDVPVTGRTDDPKFSIAKIILRIIWNVIVKAATSPFSLLGAIFGRGEELGYVDFEYGGYAVSDQEMKKLDTLVKALYERPALKLSIEGHVDVEKDKEGLRVYLFDKKLKAQKLKEMVKEMQPAIPVEDVKIAPEEYDKYLKMAYKAEDFPKPRNIIGFAKSLPSPEMEKLMLTNIAVKDEDLRQLAAMRAEKVKKYILDSGKVGPERVFLAEPKSLAPEKKEGVKDSRVVFKLD